MTAPETPTGERASFLTDEDEMSLATSRSMQTDESVPDTLDVRSDAVAVMQSSVAPLRQPAVRIAIAVGVGMALMLAAGLVGRALRAAAQGPVD